MKKGMRNPETDVGSCYASQESHAVSNADGLNLYIFDHAFCAGHPTLAKSRVSGNPKT